MALGTGVVLPQSASATTIGYSCLKYQGEAHNYCGGYYKLLPTQSLDAGGGYSLRMDPHGYLLLLHNGSAHCWQSGGNVAGSYAVYQGDFNFVIYPDGSNHATWASGKHSGQTVNINSSGQLYVGTYEYFSNPHNC
ncbi:hypothetical protein [Fodinicola feengrottensis]|uniref:Bulb-type lectin domain-containing protein n=1 Tax=Fodinicola feengrottensis TaxID=435914 RepID=A0ABP4TL26_9ACTN|nr:hypothetical protein [Fodinicola feengrottensis]